MKDDETESRILQDRVKGTDLKCPFVQGLFNATTASASASAPPKLPMYANAAERLHSATTVSSREIPDGSQGGRDKAMSADREYKAAACPYACDLKAV